MSTTLPDWMQFEDIDDTEEVSDVTSYKFTYPDEEVTLWYSNSDHAYYRFDTNGDRVDLPGVTTVLGIIDKSGPLMKWSAKLAVETVRAGMTDEQGRFRQLSTEEFNALLEDARTKHTQRLEEAGDVGHVVHDILEKLIKAAIKGNNGVVIKPVGAVHEDPRVVNSVAAGLGWMERHRVRWVFSERKIFSREFQVAGTGDGLAYVSSCDDPLCCPDKRIDALDFIDFKTSNGMRTTYPVQVSIYVFAYVEETGEPVSGRWILKLGKETGNLVTLYCPPETFEIHLQVFLDALALYRSVAVAEDWYKEAMSGKRALKKAIKEEIKQQEKAAKAVAKADAKAERVAKKAAQDAHYKQLRAQGVTVVEAKALAFPKVVAEAPTDCATVQTPVVVTKPLQLSTSVKAVKADRFLPPQTATDEWTL